MFMTPPTGVGIEALAAAGPTGKWGLRPGSGGTREAWALGGWPGI